MGFSIIGLLIGISILIPNILFIIFPPKNVPEKLKDAGIIFTSLERIGEVGCLFILAISQDKYQNFNIDIWFVLMVICILIYYSLWIRYVAKGHEFSLAFKPLYFIPIPMAVFPVLAFAFASLWGKSIYLAFIVILLAIGHFTNSWHTYKVILKSK